MYICDCGDYIFEMNIEEVSGDNQSINNYNLSADFIKSVEGAYEMSETRYGFTKMSVNEFKNWIQKQGNYSYNGIQIHHTAAPSYANFYKADGSHEDELVRQNNMKSSHPLLLTWNDFMLF